MRGKCHFASCSLHLPCSLSKPVTGSCCLYNGVRTAGNSGVRRACPSLLCIRRFCNTTKRFRYFFSSSFAFISLSLTCLFYSSFSLSVHHRFLTKAAAQSGLTTPPVQCCPSAKSFSLPSLSLKELAWHKQRKQRRKTSLSKTKNTWSSLRELFTAFA